MVLLLLRGCVGIVVRGWGRGARKEKELDLGASRKGLFHKLCVRDERKGQVEPSRLRGLAFFLVLPHYTVACHREHAMLAVCSIITMVQPHASRPCTSHLLVLMQRKPAIVHHHPTIHLLLFLSCFGFLLLLSFLLSFLSATHTHTHTHSLSLSLSLSLSSHTHTHTVLENRTMVMSL